MDSSAAVAHAAQILHDRGPAALENDTTLKGPVRKEGLRNRLGLLFHQCQVSDMQEVANYPPYKQLSALLRRAGKLGGEPYWPIGSDVFHRVMEMASLVAPEPSIRALETFVQKYRGDAQPLFKRSRCYEFIFSEMSREFEVCGSDDWSYGNFGRLRLHILGNVATGKDPWSGLPEGLSQRIQSSMQEYSVSSEEFQATMGYNRRRMALRIKKLYEAVALAVMTIPGPEKPSCDLPRPQRTGTEGIAPSRHCYRDVLQELQNAPYNIRLSGPDSQPSQPQRRRPGAAGHQLTAPQQPRQRTSRPQISPPQQGVRRSSRQRTSRPQASPQQQDVRQSSQQRPSSRQASPQQQDVRQSSQQRPSSRQASPQQQIVRQSSEQQSSSVQIPSWQSSLQISSPPVSPRQQSIRKSSQQRNSSPQASPQQQQQQQQQNLRQNSQQRTSSPQASPQQQQQQQQQSVSKSSQQRTSSPQASPQPQQPQQQSTAIRQSSSPRDAFTPRNAGSVRQILGRRQQRHPSSSAARCVSGNNDNGHNNDDDRNEGSSSSSSSGTSSSETPTGPAGAGGSIRNRNTDTTSTSTSKKRDRDMHGNY